MKYQKSNFTKKVIRLRNLFLFLSIAITVFPMMFYVIKAFAEGAVHEKLTLGIMATVAIIISIFSIWRKIVLRSTIWILLLGIYICMDYILPLILMVAIGTILDEMILTPLYKHYKAESIASKVIDKRS